MEQYIPWVISAVMMVFAILTYARNGKQKSDENESFIKESLLKVNLKLDQVCTTTTETRTDIKSLNKDMQGLENRIVAVERDIKTAFKQIDELKK